MSLLGIGRAARDIGGAVTEVSEVFTVNRTKAEMATLARYEAALAQAGAEFQQGSSGWFDRFVNGLNRLPRPIMALSTVGLFAYAMSDPAGFSVRMQGLAYIPEPLWWLLGAVVSFYFGARELNYFRGYRANIPPAFVAGRPVIQPQNGANSALVDWLNSSK
ncbi:MAG: holin family protein [Rhodobacteraceae bacterium]|nr:holin family protein [Paracoccaceae bacterium]